MSAVKQLKLIGLNAVLLNAKVLNFSDTEKFKCYVFKMLHEEICIMSTKTNCTDFQKQIVHILFTTYATVCQINKRVIGWELLQNLHILVYNLF